ncbi:MAG: ABC transporter ATP-binding protein [Coxiella sp. (in: Bacteria)]|nr:MAG: ABC transporter ATP-binding protein [Coxiella sp. (in: g-proteobacteria)]
MASTSVLSSFKKLFHILNVSEKRQLIMAASMAFFVALMEVITAISIALFAQSLVRPENVYMHLHKYHLIKTGFNPQQILLYMAILCGVTYLIKNVGASFDVFHQNKVIQRIGLNIKKRLLQKYMGLSYEKYITRNSSIPLSVMNTDINRAINYGLVQMMGIFSEGLVFVILIAFIVYVNPVFALVIFAVGALIALLMIKYLLPLSYRLGDNLSTSTKATNFHLVQLLHTFKEVVLAAKEAKFSKSYNEQAVTMADANCLFNVFQHFPRIIIETIFIGLFVLSVVYLCLTKQSSAHIMALMGGYLYAAFRLMPGLNRIITQLNNAKSAIKSIDMVDEEFKLNDDTLQSLQSVTDFSFTSMIRLQDVNFKYASEDRMILQHINLTISKGECVGVVGSTGSGKSTLIDLMLGLLQPTSGDITIDGKYPVNCRQWHEMIGYVPQSLNLIDDSIKANIAFGDETELVDERHIASLIKQVQLTHLVAKLEKGVETPVGERGVQLSGGERQRIAIARALYTDPDVLIFDEATSALDTETESQMMETIYSVAKDHTVIMVAHRISTLKGCDRIFVFEEGALKSVTTYDELIEETI